MRIGLLTFHYSMNYGAIMQTYATCRALQELGHDVTIIDFRQPEKKTNRSLLFYYKTKAFDRFTQKHYPRMTKTCYTLDDVIDNSRNFDCLVVGSDQTWNPHITKDKRLIYFFPFAGDIKSFRLIIKQ